MNVTVFIIKEIERVYKRRGDFIRMKLRIHGFTKTDVSLLETV
jgi:hypothetical protein